MYDKYSVFTAVTPAATKLPKHKGLLVINDTSAGSVVFKGYLSDGTPSSNITVPTEAKTVKGYSILPFWVYSVESATNCTVYLLN